MVGPGKTARALLQSGIGHGPETVPDSWNVAVRAEGVKGVLRSPGVRVRFGIGTRALRS